MAPDDQFQLGMLKKLLTRDGFEVTTVSNDGAVEALQHFLMFDVGMDITANVQLLTHATDGKPWVLSWRSTQSRSRKSISFSDYRELVAFIKAGVWTMSARAQYPVNEESSLVGSMLLKLVARGEPVAVDALGRTFLSGNEARGYTALRSRKTGWVIQYDYRRGGGDASSRVAASLLADSLDVSSSKQSAMLGTGTHHSSLFQLERPIDEHYTVRKVDGVWTIIDREKVDEDKQDRHEHAEFMLRQAAKKMVAAGLSSKVMPHAGAVWGPYIETEYAGFKINTFYGPDEHGNKWFGAWYRDGRRAGGISNFKTVEEIIKDIL